MKHFLGAYMPPGGIITHVTISNIFWYSVKSRLSVIPFSNNCGALYKIQSIFPQAIDQTRDTPIQP